LAAKLTDGAAGNGSRQSTANDFQDGTHNSVIQVLHVTEVIGRKIRQEHFGGSNAQNQPNYNKHTID
jgi:hypothetical protein